MNILKSLESFRSIFLTAVIPYACPFTRPKSVLSSASSGFVGCENQNIISRVFSPKETYMDCTAHQGVVI